MVGFRGSGFLTITVDSKRVEQMLTGLKTTIPEGIKMGAKKTAGMYAEEYLKQIRVAGITNWTSRSAGILARQAKNPERIGNGFGVIVPASLLSLDRLKQFSGPEGQFGFPVRLRAGRSITRWALSKGKASIRRAALRGGTIWVKRHPWLNEANRKARKRVTDIIQKELDKKIRAKGRR